MRISERMQKLLDDLRKAGLPEDTEGKFLEAIAKNFIALAEYTGTLKGMLQGALLCTPAELHITQTKIQEYLKELE